MILIVTNANDFTANFLEEKIKIHRLPYYRFNTEDFPQKVRMQWIYSSNEKKRILKDIRQGKIVNLEDVRVIWWRRPFNPGPQISDLIKDEKIKEFTKLQVEETLSNLWDSLASNCFWVNHPRNNYKASAKLYQLDIAQRAGFLVPDSILTNDPEKALEFCKTHQKVVIKTLRQKPLVFNGKIYGFYTSLVSKEDLNFIQDVQYAPVLLQEYIEKDLELRVTVVGNEVFTAAIDSQATEKGAIDWRKENPTKQRWFSYNIPRWVYDACIQILRHFDLNFGAIDIIVNPNGQFVFLEINPNGQWAWLEIEIGLPISDAFIDLFSKKLS